MTRKQHITHSLAVVLSIAAGIVVEVLTTSPLAHAVWAPAALAVAKYVVTALGADVAAGFIPAVFLAFWATSCAHIGGVLKACGPDIIGAVDTALVCDLFDKAPLPACVVSAIAEIASKCDVTPLMQERAANADRQFSDTGDNLEAVKAARARAWLAAQGPNPGDLPPLHDRKAK